ncbi:MAG: metallophosphoesterase [Sporolactobacillus sp.]
MTALWIFYGLLVLALFILIVLMCKEAFLNRLVPLTLTIDELPEALDGLTIFFISDIHRRLVSEELLRQLPKRPDYVVIGGDLAERFVPSQRIRENLSRLRQLAPIFFVWGNHDRFAGKQRIETLLREAGVTVLNNDTAVITRNGAAINFSGVDDETHHHDDLERALSRRRAGVPTLLFSHNPGIQKQLHATMQLAYTICGHTHGGQINLFGFTIKEKGGVKQGTFGTLIISNGYGTTKLPLRFGAPPETHFFTLGRK